MYIKAVNTSYFLGRFEETQYLSIKNMQGKQQVFHLVKYMYGQSQGRLLEVMKLPHLLGYDNFFMRKKKSTKRPPLSARLHSVSQSLLFKRCYSGNNSCRCSWSNELDAGSSGTNGLPSWIGVFNCHWSSACATTNWAFRRNVVYVFFLPKQLTEVCSLCLVIYMLWFSFILGLILIFPCFKLFITHVHYYAQKQRKIKFKPRKTT